MKAPNKLSPIHGETSSLWRPVAVAAGAALLVAACTSANKSGGASAAATAPAAGESMVGKPIAPVHKKAHRRQPVQPTPPASTLAPPPQPTPANTPQIERCTTGPTADTGVIAESSANSILEADRLQLRKLARRAVEMGGDTGGTDAVTDIVLEPNASGPTDIRVEFDTKQVDPHTNQLIPGAINSVISFGPGGEINIDRSWAVCRSNDGNVDIAMGSAAIFENAQIELPTFHANPANGMPNGWLPPKLAV